MNTRVVNIKVGRSKEIMGTLIDPGADHRSPAILFIHGWQGNRNKYVTLAETIFARCGFVCLAIDLEGHGESSGKIESVSRENNFNDVLAAYDYLQKLPQVNENRITVIGSSYGGYLAMLLAGVRRPAQLVLRAPALYRDAGFALPTKQAIAGLSDYRTRAVQAGRNKALSALRTFQGDALIIAGSEDEDVPLQTIQNVKRALANSRSQKIEIILGADHRLSQELWREYCNSTMKAWVIEKQGVV
jgi:esterase/lipase